MISDEGEQSAKRGIIVCLGWVPLKNESDNFEVYEPEPYDPKIENEEGPQYVYDIGTQMTYSAEELSPEDPYGQFYVKDVVEIEGFLRKDEKSDFLMGVLNDPRNANLR